MEGRIPADLVMCFLDNRSAYPIALICVCPCTRLYSLYEKFGMSLSGFVWVLRSLHRITTFVDGNLFVNLWSPMPYLMRLICSTIMPFKLNPSLYELEHAKIGIFKALLWRQLIAGRIF